MSVPGFTEPVARLLAMCALVAMVASLAACAQSGDGTACVPRCEGLCNSGDGCGGICGCPQGQQCNGSGFCMWEAACTESCFDVGAVCGSVCGQFCGDCGPTAICSAGQCRCEPDCDGSHCGDDECGGTCACGAGDLCNAAGQCVAGADCHDTCDTAICGEICGTACGQCPADDVCRAGECTCVADCDGSHCGDDGCGQACPPPCGSEPVDVSCDSCALRLTVVASGVEAGQRRATVAVDYLPLEHEPRARIADLRVRASAPVTMLAATPGDALVRGGKTLWVDGETGNAWRRLDIATHQLLVLSTEDTLRMDSGRIVTLELWLQGAGPVALSLVKRDETLAPSDADLALQSTSYDSSIVITAGEGGP